MLSTPSLIQFVFVAAGDSVRDLNLALQSLRASAFEVSPQPSISVVDNHSACAHESLPADFPDVRLFHAGGNIGYGPAINFVRLRLDQLGEPAPQWIIACNTDLIFPRDSYIQLLRALSTAPSDSACMAPMLLNSAQDGGGIQPSVGEFPTLTTLLTGRLKPRTTRKYIPTPLIPTEVDWATASCLALRTEAFDEVGGFDSQIFLDYEETDLCCRLAARGWKSRIEPDWKVIHTSPNAHRPASPDRQVHTRQSMVRYLAKHRPSWELRAMGAMLRATVAVHRKDHPFAPSWRAGLHTYRQLSSAGTIPPSPSPRGQQAPPPG